MAGSCGLHHPECVVGGHERLQDLEVTIPIVKGKTAAFNSVSFVATIGNTDQEQPGVLCGRHSIQHRRLWQWQERQVCLMEGRLVANSF